MDIRDMREALKELERVGMSGPRRMVGVTLTDREIRKLDRYVQRHGYASRMELLRSMVLVLIQGDKR